MTELLIFATCFVVAWTVIGLAIGLIVGPMIKFGMGDRDKCR